MPSVIASHEWPDESVTMLAVEIEPGWPDAVDEAKVLAVRGLLEMVGALTVDEAEE